MEKTNTFTPNRYYFCPETNKYVKFEKGFFYSIEKTGELVKNSYYDAILIGSIYTEDITKEKFESHLK